MKRSVPPGSDNSSIDASNQKGFAQETEMKMPRLPVPKTERLLEFDKGNAVICDIITNPRTGVCYAKCMPLNKGIAAPSRYLKDDKVEIDDVTFTKNPSIAREWIRQGYNVAIYTGILEKSVIEDNVVILDVDLKEVAPEEEPGFLAPKYVIDALAEKTLTIETRSGGLQYIFKNKINLISNPRLRYIDRETGEVKDAGDTRAKHAYALFAGSYVPPDMSDPKKLSMGVAKPLKKPLPHADGLYRVVFPAPVADLTEPLLESCGLTLFGGSSLIARRRSRPRRTDDKNNEQASRDAEVIDFKQVSSYGRRIFRYSLSLNELKSLAASASPDSIRNSDGQTLESIAYTNQKIFRLIQPRDSDYRSRGVTNDETESAENAALAFEMVKRGFTDPDVIAKAILLYQPRDKNFDIRADGTSYLADTIAGAFDLYEFIQKHNVSEHAIDTPNPEDGDTLSSLPVANQATISQGRGYSYLADVARDDPRIVFDTWSEFPPMSPDWSDIMLWRGDPRSGKSWHSVLYMAQHNSGTYITHRHEILDSIFERLTKLTEASGKTIVRLAGKSRACPYATTGSSTHRSCSTCHLRPVGNRDDSEDGDGIPFIEYKQYAEYVLSKYRAIGPETLRNLEPGYCPYYLLKYAEPVANYCLTVPQFISPVTNVDGFKISPREYTVIDEEPTIDSFYPSTPAIFEYHTYGFGEDHVTNLLITNNVIGAIFDIKDSIKKKNPNRITRVNRIILNICDNLLLINTELIKFAGTTYRDKKERTKFVNRVMPYMKFYGDISDDTKIKVMQAVIEHLHNTNYVLSGDVLSYFQPFLYPYIPEFLSWQASTNGRGPKQVLYLISDRKLMFDIDFSKLLVIGATEAEMFVDDIRGSRTVSRIDLNLFPYSQNYTFVVAEGDTTRDQERLVYKMMVSQHVANREAVRATAPTTTVNSLRPGTSPRIIPFLVVTPSKSRQEEIVRRLSQYGRILSLDEHDTRADVLRYYHTGYSVAFYNNGTIARGVDLPEFDMMFFIGGGFATPRITAFERANLRDGYLSVSERLAKIRASKISDEYTNSAMRGSPIYTMKSRSKKVLYISRAAFSCLYPSVYKGADVISANNENFSEIVEMVSRFPDSITQHWVETDKLVNCGILDQVDHIIYDRIEKNNVVCALNPGSEISGDVGSANAAEISEISGQVTQPRNDVFTPGEKNPKYYQRRDAVAKSVLGALAATSDGKQRLTQDAVIDTVYKRKYIRRRNITKKEIKSVIDYLVDTKQVVRTEVVDYSKLPVDGAPPVKVYLTLPGPPPGSQTPPSHCEHRQ